MKTRVPPPVVTLAVGLLMWLGDRLLPALAFTFPGQGPLALVLAAAGVLLMGVAVLSFARAKTTVNPLRPSRASALVTGGVYRFSRNPIYLADLLLLLAFAAWLGSLAALAVSPLLVWYLNAFQIAPEEEALAALFGDEYRAYCARVRRWLQLRPG